jgi:cytochrome c556
MKKLLPGVLILAAAPMLGGASPGATAARARHQRFETIGRAFKGVQDQARRKPVNAAALRTTTTVLATLAARTKEWFPAGSGPRDGVKTDALPAAWTDRAELNRQADLFAAAARNLVTAAEDGDEAVIRAAIRTTGETCKSCHDRFRKR